MGLKYLDFYGKLLSTLYSFYVSQDSKNKDPVSTTTKPLFFKPPPKKTHERKESTGIFAKHQKCEDSGEGNVGAVVSPDTPKKSICKKKINIYKRWSRTDKMYVDGPIVI